MAYRNIHSQFWTDEKIVLLGSDAKLFYIYLLTNPQCNMIGAYKLPVPQMVFEFFSPTEYNADYQGCVDKIHTLLHTLSDTLSIGYSIPYDIVYIRNFLNYNQIVGPKQYKGAITLLEHLPCIPELKYIAQALKTIAEKCNYEQYPILQKILSLQESDTLSKEYRKGIDSQGKEKREKGKEKREKGKEKHPPISPQGDCPDSDESGRDIAPEPPDSRLNSEKPNLPLTPPKGRAALDSKLDAMIDEYTSNEVLRAELKVWKRERKEVMKKPLSVEALRRNLSNLSKLASTDSEKIAIVSRSIEKSWRGFFELAKKGAPPGERPTSQFERAQLARERILRETQENRR